MRTVLIPTDFYLPSLACVDNLVRKFPKEKLEVILVHLLGVTDSPQELQMLSRRSAEYRCISEDFYAACIELKRKYKANIHNIRIEFFYGNTMAAFKNYLAANSVGLVIDMVDHHFEKLTDKSLNHRNFIKRCGWNVMPMSIYSWPPASKAAVTAELQEEEV